MGVFPINAQSVPKTDEATNPKCEELLARLENFTLEMATDTTATGVILLIPGKDNIKNAVYEKFLRRQIDRLNLKSRVQLKTVAPSQNAKVVFRKDLSGGTGGESAEPLAKTLVEGKKPILFDSELFEFFPDSGRIGIAGMSCGACCLTALDWVLLDEFLSANRKLTAYVVIRGPVRRHAILRDYIRKEIQNDGVRAKRFRYLYANRNRVNRSQFSEVAVFLSRRKFTGARQPPSEFFPD